jgi:hypothetical protein
VAKKMMRKNTACMNKQPKNKCLQKEKGFIMGKG